MQNVVRDPCLAGFFVFCTEMSGVTAIGNSLGRVLNEECLRNLFVMNSAVSIRSFSTKEIGSEGSAVVDKRLIETRTFFFAFVSTHDHIRTKKRVFPRITFDSAKKQKTYERNHHSSPRLFA